MGDVTSLFTGIHVNIRLLNICMQQCNGVMVSDYIYTSTLYIRDFFLRNKNIWGKNT